MFTSQNLNGQVILPLNDSATQRAHATLTTLFGKINILYISAVQTTCDAIAVKIWAPDNTLLFICNITYQKISHVENKVFAKCAFTPSDTFTRWILADIASRVTTEDSEYETCIKNRYTLIGKNLQGLASKLRIFGVSTIIFFCYFLIASAALTGTIFTDSKSAQRYGKPICVTLTLIVFGLFMAFLIATACFSKEKRQLSTEFESVRSNLINLCKITPAVLIEKCNQYLTTKGINIELITPITTTNNPQTGIDGEPPEVVITDTQQVKKVQRSSSH